MRDRIRYVLQSSGKEIMFSDRNGGDAEQSAEVSALTTADERL